MQLTRKTALLTIGMLVLAACAPPPPAPAAKPDTAADEAGMTAATEAWAQAYNSGDVETIVGMYAEDAVMMPPDVPLARGHAAMREFLTTDIAGAKAAGVTLHIVDGSTGVSGDLGWHSGTFKVTDASGTTVGTGKYSEVWHRADGKWRIIRDIWNNDAPASAAAAAPPAAAPAG